MEYLRFPKGQIKGPFWINIFFIVYLLICLLLNKVMCINHDSGLMIAEVCSSGSIPTPSGRYIYFLNFLLSYLARIANWNLFYLFICHVMNIWFLHYIPSLLLVYYFKRLDLAIAHCALIIVYLANGIYLPHGEIYGGAFFAVILIAVGQNRNTGLRAMISALMGILVSIALVVFYHPVFVITGLYAALYSFVTSKHNYRLAPFVILSGAVIGFLIKKTFLVSDHESSGLAKVLESGTGLLVAFITKPSDIFTFLLIFHCVFLFIAVLLLSINDRKSAISTLVSCMFAISILLLSVARFPMRSVNIHYLWYSSFMAFFFLIIPLFDINTKKRAIYYRIIPITLVIVLISSVQGLTRSVTESNREEKAIISILQLATPGDHLFIVERNPLTDTVFQNWNLASKSLLISSLPKQSYNSRCLAFDTSKKFLHIGVKASKSGYFHIPELRSAEEAILIKLDK